MNYLHCRSSYYLFVLGLKFIVHLNEMRNFFVGYLYLNL